MKSKNIEAAYPLSPMQQGMLFHTLYAPPETGVYFQQLRCTLHGKLNVSAFQRAWQRIVDRHPVCRTAFVWDNIEKPLQVVGRRVRLPWEQHDWRGLSAVEQQEQLETFFQADRERGFQMSKAPLMRLALIQVDEDTYQFVWSYHHLLLDGWSVSLMFKEVFAFYEAFCRGQDLHLEHSHPYEDYIAWLQQQDLAKAEAFWRQALKGFTAPTQLGVDRALGSLSSEGESYSEQQIQLSVAATAALQSFARQHQLTFNTLVQGAWVLLLSRYSGEADVVFGATVSGRSAAWAGAESMVGLFINTLPVRVLVSPEANLLAWLKQLQAQQVELRQYEYSPLVQVQGWSDLPRSLPLFESIVVFRNYPINASLLEQGGSLEFRNVCAVEQTNYPLTLMAAPGAELSLNLSYDCRRFDAATITRMLWHLQTLLEGIVAAPEQRLGDLPVLTQPERQQLLVEWNDTQVDYPQDKCVHQLFEAQVERTPDAVAVVFESQQLTYRELNRRANQLAHHLQGLGVGPEVLVGICVERSLEMVVGLLGILKAGGAYMPLDPAYPKERLAFMLSDSQVSVLLTQEKLVAGLPEHRTRVVCLDKDWEIISQEREENPVIGVKPENLAYVIYTSGSTGRPKGVAIEHHNSVLLLDWAQKVFTTEQLSGVLASTSICFDLSVFELFVALSWGGKVILAENALHLPTLSNAKDVTLINTVPSAVVELLRVNGLPDGVRVVNLAGEPLQNPLVQQIYQQDTIEQVFNLYGPSEDTTYSTFALAKKGASKSPPIGRPIANTQTYILDRHLQPVPVGVPGELYIGGAGLARGYLNHPELTAERFIPNCFSDEPGVRLYKTGDLVRYLSDGNIEYLGRLDHQVKIRGFRIELGEIEAVLSQHPAVQQTVVMVREDVPGNKRLVAYVVVNQGTAPSIPELHHFLKAKLPEYMVPSAIVLLETLPLTPNGKVNRRALPAPDAARPELQQAFVAPRDTLELQLAQIWEDVLDVRPIGITDNFFTLGGHSLLAVRLMTQIQQQFEQNLPLATLFQAPTIEQLASTLRQRTGSRHWSALVEIQPGGSKRPFFCMPGGGGNVIYLYHLARHLGSDQPFYGLQARGLDGEQVPHTRIEDIAAYNIEALRTVQPQGPYLLGGHSFGSFVAFEMALQLQKQGQEVALLALMDTQAPVPGNKPVEIERDDARDLTELASIIERFFGKNLSVSYDDLQPLEPDEQLNYVLERLKMVNIFPPEARLLQLRGFLQVFKANNPDQYLSQEVYPNRIIVFRASEEFRDDPAIGWDKFSSEPVETHDVPGDHITMMVEPHVQVLAEQLRACLDQVQADD